MAFDGRVTSLIAQGLAADRPAVPNIDPDTISFYFATDTSELSVYANSTWYEDVLGVGAGDMLSANNLSDVSSPSTSLTNLGLSANGSSLVTAANYAAMRTLLGLVIGTNVQAFDAQLSDVAALSYGSNALKVVRVNAGETAFELATPGAGSVTTTGSPASGNLAKFSGASSIVNGDLSGDVTTSGTLAATIANSAVTLAKIANAAASSKLLGSGASGSGAAYAEITLGTNLSMSGTTLNATGGGSGNVWNLQFGPLDNEPPSSNYATLDTRNGHPTLRFDTTTQETAIWSGALPADYSGAGITVHIFCSLTSATSGTVGWDVSIERMDASTLDIDADSFASAQTVTAVTVPGTSGQLLKMSVNISNGANMDSLAAGEMFRLRVRRDVANDTATGDAELLRVMMVSQ